MDKKTNIQFPTYTEIDSVSKEYSEYETRYIYWNKNIKQTEIDRHFKYAVDWVIKYLKIKNE